jgi:hypothetical protein
VDWELQFVHPHRCYIVRWLVDLSRERTREYWKALIANPEFQPGYAVLHDLRGRSIRRGFEDTAIQRDIYRREVAPHVGEGRAALLVDSAMAYSQEKLLTLMLGMEDTVLVTYSEDEARRWVGLPADHPLPAPAGDGGR